MQARRPSSAKALILGALGSCLLTASSLYIALKMGALPWPIVFAVLLSVGALRLFGSHDLHEANVAHAAMSAGSMVAGGLAFTIPGLWIFSRSQGLDLDVNLIQLICTALAGTLLGLGACALLQPYFIREQKLAFPIGESAAQTLKATDAQNFGSNSKALFGAMGVSALFALLRDGLAILPQVLLSGVAIPGVSFGIMNSTMIVSMGFLIGVTPALVWLLGAVLGNFFITGIPPMLGLISVELASAIKSSLGLGLMVGVGVGIILKGAQTALGAKRKQGTSQSSDSRSLSVKRLPVALLVSVAAALFALALDLGLIASCVLIVLTWFCVYLSAWLTGTTGVNPMEIFGVMVLIALQFFFHNLSYTTLFLAAAVVAVAAGVCGDVMNDFKAGDVLRTNPRDQFIGMALGALIGAAVASITLILMRDTYGTTAFGVGTPFVAAQANVVAQLAAGIPNLPAFICGCLAGVILALFKLPVLTLGLGVYLPFYISAGAALGALIRLAVEKLAHLRGISSEKALERGGALAAGLLGGESLTGVLIAIFLMLTSFFG